MASMAEALSPVLELLKDKSIKRKWMLGLESERFLLHPDGKLAQFSDLQSFLLKELAQTNAWKVVYQVGEFVLGLRKNGHDISLEPGAQFEISAAPQKSICELREIEKAIESEVLATQAAKDCQWLFLGMNPKYEALDIELIPSPRYQIMTDYFPTKAARGREMMRLTTGFHLNLDFYETSEAIDLLRACYFVVPYLTGIFCNSPFYKGRRSKALSERQLVWQETDPIRSGFLDGIFHKDYSSKDYVNFVESTELMYFSDEQGGSVAANGKALQDLPASLQQVNAVSALRQVFKDVRLKPCCVELRCFDQQLPEYRYAAIALAVGLVYDEKNRAQLISEALASNEKSHQALQVHGAMVGLKDDLIYEKAKMFLQMADQGLERRGLEESKFLAPIEKLLSCRQTPAELIDQSSDWNSL